MSCKNGIYDGMSLLSLFLLVVAAVLFVAPLVTTAQKVAATIPIELCTITNATTASALPSTTLEEGDQPLANVTTPDNSDTVIIVSRGNQTQTSAELLGHIESLTVDSTGRTVIIFSIANQTQIPTTILEPDYDGDGIPDSEDSCPTEPENYNQYQDTDGCPEPGIQTC